MAPSKKRGIKAKNKIVKPTYLNHESFLAPMSSTAEGQDLPYLGNPRAVATVLNCADTSPSNLFSTLDQLGVNGLAFQQCVYGSIGSLGYEIAVDSIPDAPTSTLISVVDAIQYAKKA